MFGISFAVYAALGWAGAYFVRVYNWDGVTRIAQAHGVLFSRDPHLAALGFIWPPFPAICEIPLVLILKQLGLVLLAGPLMSSLFGAFALAQTALFLQRLGIPRGWRLVWVTALGAHKLILHNNVMGLSEAPFMAFLFLSLNGFLQWEQEKQPTGLVWAGIGAALAAFCRYEALAWSAAVSLGIIWVLAFQTSSVWSRASTGSLLTFIAVPAWAMLLWILMNWQITGSPIYFLVGPGSTATTPDTAHVVGQSHPFFYAQGSVVGSILLLLKQAIELAPLLLPSSFLLATLAVLYRRWSDMAYLAMTWSILGFLFLIAFMGMLPPWSRYFFWMVPAEMIAAALAYRAVGVGRLKLGIALCTTILMIGSTGGLHLQAWNKIQQPLPQRILSALVAAPETAEYAWMGGQLDEFAEMAEYLNSQPKGKLTMIDASVGSGIVFFVQRPDELVLTTDSDFFKILAAPVGQVDQILVPRPTFDAMGRSEILKAYPGIYDGAEPWARLVHEFKGPGGWRLFQVVRSST